MAELEGTVQADPSLAARVPSGADRQAVRSGPQPRAGLLISAAQAGGGGGGVQGTRPDI